MNTNYSEIDFHRFVSEQLDRSGFRILLITEEMMIKRLDDFMSFVNSIRTEHSRNYGWNAESREYFLNGLNDKWKYSFTIIDENDKLCFVNFSSVYGDIIHNHCTYASKKTRNMNLAKLHNIKLCQSGLDNGFKQQEGFWPKNNNGSIILFLKMDWEIQSIRNNRDLLMKADLEKVRNKTYSIITGH